MPSPIPITLLCAGSTGDTLPFIALGDGLRRAGHAVRIASDREFEPLAAAHGLEFFASSENARAIVQEHMGELIGQANPIKAMRKMQELLPILRAGEEQQYRVWLEASE